MDLNVIAHIPPPLNRRRDIFDTTVDSSGKRAETTLEKSAPDFSPGLFRPLAGSVIVSYRCVVIDSWHKGQKAFSSAKPAMVVILDAPQSLLEPHQGVRTGWLPSGEGAESSWKVCGGGGRVAWSMDSGAAT